MRWSSTSCSAGRPSCCPRSGGVARRLDHVVVGQPVRDLDVGGVVQDAAHRALAAGVLRLDPGTAGDGRTVAFAVGVVAADERAIGGEQHLPAAHVHVGLDSVDLLGDPLLGRDLRQRQLLVDPDLDHELAGGPAAGLLAADGDQVHAGQRQQPLGHLALDPGHPLDGRRVVVGHRSLTSRARRRPGSADTSFRPARAALPGPRPGPAAGRGSRTARTRRRSGGRPRRAACR